MASLGRRRFLSGSLAVAGAAYLAACGTEEDRTESVPEPPDAYRYGDAPLQVSDLYLPSPVESTADGLAVVVLVHGGYWRPGFDRELMAPLVPSLTDRGWAVWNIDYRVLGRGGGWPETYEDTASAVDLLSRAASDHPLDLTRVAAVGHSAGATLALWSAARGRLPADAAGAGPRVELVAAAALAGLNDLEACAMSIDGGGCVGFMGAGPDEDDRYDLASPAARLPIGRPQLVVHGGDDDVVRVSQSEDYAVAAEAAGDEVTLEIVDGADHMDMIDPSSEAWAITVGWLGDRLR